MHLTVVVLKVVDTATAKRKVTPTQKTAINSLAWAYIEAANFAIRFNPTVKRYYQRKLAKTNVILAKKAVAHKLARACFYVLRDQVAFDVKRAFG